MERRRSGTSWSSGSSRCTGARSIEPRPRYRELLDKRGRSPSAEELSARAAEFSRGELRDLTVLFYLSWIGFAARRGDAELVALEHKGRDFSDEDFALVVERQRRPARACCHCNTGPRMPAATRSAR